MHLIIHTSSISDTFSPDLHSTQACFKESSGSRALLLARLQL